MDTPPPIPPAATSLAAPVANAIDEKLLKRARNAGRNLSALAVLSTIAALVLIAVALFGEGDHGMMAVLATAVSLIVAGLWVLAVAARRGNSNAVGVVIVAIVLQLCLALISSGVIAARSNTAFQPPVAGMVIPILVLVALASNLKVLLDLKKRQLWGQVFGSAKPSGNLCLIGGVLLGIGYVAMIAAGSYIVWGTGQQQAEIQHAQAFVNLIQVDEKEFLTAMQGISGNQDQNEIETALTRLTTLEQNFEVLNKEAAIADPLLQILTTYGDALRQWKNGLTLLKEPNADTDRVKKMLDLGDRLRNEAGLEFDRQYAPKRPEAGI